MLINVYSGVPSPWTAVITMSCLMTQIVPNCLTYNSNLDSCTSCNAANPILVTANFIPLQTCVSTLINNCNIYNVNGTQCVASCSGGNIVITNVFPPTLCITTALIPNCLIYNYNGTVCVSCTDVSNSGPCVTCTTGIFLYVNKSGSANVYACESTLHTCAVGSYLYLDKSKTPNDYSC